MGAPASTSEVEALLRAVNQHPEQRRLWLDIKSWLIQHQTAVGLSLAVLALLIVNHIWIALLVRRRGRQLLHAGEQLRRQEQALENARQLNVLGKWPPASHTSSINRWRLFATMRKDA